jgi:hypothetical protein
VTWKLQVQIIETDFLLEGIRHCTSTLPSSTWWEPHAPFYIVYYYECLFFIDMCVRCTPDPCLMATIFSDWCIPCIVAFHCHVCASHARVLLALIAPSLVYFFVVVELVSHHRYFVVSICSTEV